MTLVLVIVTSLISWIALQRHELLYQLSHRPQQEVHHGQWYRLVSSGFVHGSIPHLVINMYVLYQFGGIVERLFGSMFGANMANLMFMLFYLSAIVVANLGTLVKHKDHPGFSSVGASGVTTALVFIYAIFDPWQMFLFPPVPAILFAILYVGYSTWASSQDRDNIDHLAHLYGGLYGIAFLFITYPDSMQIFWERLMSGMQ